MSSTTSDPAASTSNPEESVKFTPEQLAFINGRGNDFTDYAAPSPPPGVIPTTEAPATTQPPAVTFTDVNISGVKSSTILPVLGSGGVKGSFEKTTGTVNIKSVVLDKPYTEEVSYIVYDASGSKNEYGDPINFVTGAAGVVVNENNESEIQINEQLTITADPDSGNMDVVVQVRDKNYTTKTVSETIVNPIPAVTTTPTPVGVSTPGPTTEVVFTPEQLAFIQGGSSTPAPSRAVIDTTVEAPTDIEVVFTPEQLAFIQGGSSTPAPSRAVIDTTVEAPTDIEVVFTPEQLAFIQGGSSTPAPSRAVIDTTVEAPTDIEVVFTPEQLAFIQGMAAQEAVQEASDTFIGEEIEEAIVTPEPKPSASFTEEQLAFIRGAASGGVVNNVTPQPTTRPPGAITTPSLVPRLGDDDTGTEGDTDFIPQLANNTPTIAVNDITVNNTAIEDNVDLTVEISNADHWNFSIDGGSNVRVNSYDLDHQLCADQAFDPHGVDDPPPRFGLSEEELFEELKNDALEDLEEWAEEADDERSQAVFDSLTDDLNRLDAPFRNMLDGLDELVERLKPINEALERAGIDDPSSPEAAEFIENDPVLRGQLERIGEGIDLDVEGFTEVLESVFEDIAEKVDEGTAHWQEMKDNPDFFKEIAEELFEKLKDGTLTVEDLAKIISRAPSLGTGGALDELLYRKGWIPPARGGQWLPPYRGRAPNPRARGFFGSITDSSICSHDAPCDSPSRTVTLTVEPGEHDVLVTALDANYTPLTTASSKFAVNGPSNEVSSQDQLIAALRSFSDVKIVGNFDVTQTIQVPSNARIIGVGNPVIRTNTTAFNIGESNVTLEGFTITKLGNQQTGRGILVNRSSTALEKNISNITINRITFNQVGTPLDKYSSIAILGYNAKGLSTISDVKITNNIITGSPNNAIDVWEVDDLKISNNIISHTRSAGAPTLGNGIRGSNITNATISENNFLNIGRMGIEITGNNSSNVTIFENTIQRFAMSPEEGFRAGISLVQGMDGAIITNNIINGAKNIWNAGIEAAQNSKNIRITNNEVANVRDGIVVTAHSDSIFIDKNNLNQIKRYGIQTYQVWRVTITNNTITQSEAWRDTFETYTEQQKQSVGRGSGIFVQQSNSVSVLNNKINGVYKQEYDDAGIWFASNYPSLKQANKIHYPSADAGEELQVEMVKYSLGLDSSYNSLYGKPGIPVDTAPIQNIITSNILNGEGRLFAQNAAKVIVLGAPGTTVTTSTGKQTTAINPEENLTLPGVIVDPKVTPESDPKESSPIGEITVINDTGSKIGIKDWIDDNTDLVSDKDSIKIITPDTTSSLAGTIETLTGTTPYVRVPEIEVDTNPVIDVSTTTPTPLTSTTTPTPLTSTTPLPDIIDERSISQIARDEYIQTQLAINEITSELFLQYIAGEILVSELFSLSQAPAVEMDVDGKKEQYIAVRYDGAWKDKLLNWVYTRNTSPVSKKISEELIKLMPQDWEDESLYWASEGAIDISGITTKGTTHYDPDISYNQNMQTVKKAAVLISPVHVLMADHWRYAPSGEPGQKKYPQLEWTTDDGEKITRTIIDNGVKVDGVDTRVLILDEPVPDKLAIYPLPTPQENYNEMLTGSLVLIGNQQRKFAVGYLMAGEPTITYDPILNIGSDKVSPAIVDGNVKLSLQIVIPLLNRFIPTGYASFNDGDRPSTLDGVIKGDSGSPNFIISPNGDPILISQHHRGGIMTTGPFFGDSIVQEKIRGAMDTLSDRNNLPRYSLRTIDPATGERIDLIPTIPTIDVEATTPPPPVIAGTPAPGTPPPPVIAGTPTPGTPPPPVIDGTPPPVTSLPRLGQTTYTTSTTLYPRFTTTTTSTTPFYPNIVTIPTLPPPRIINPTPPPRWTPPPWITTRPPTYDPYIPARCRKPPEPPPGEIDSSEPGDTNFIDLPEGDPDITARFRDEQDANSPILRVFPAPIAGLQVPFYSTEDFNTNITKKTPTPYGFTTLSPLTANPVIIDFEVDTSTTICPPDEENCNILQY
tara:strand:- start:7436 stop:13468 length:6033 start_codon:yes stop_codon:yes gene_type:complete